jgi:hypothetical protein
MDSYFILRYRPAGAITATTFWPAALIGVLFAAFLFSYIPLVKGRNMPAIKPQSRRDDM